MFARFTTPPLIAALAGLTALLNEPIAATPAPSSPQLSAGKPLHFTENKGQWDERVLFKADADAGLTWFIERDGFTLLYTLPCHTERSEESPSSPDEMLHFVQHDTPAPSTSHALNFRFQQTLTPSTGKWMPQATASAPAAEVVPGDRLPWNSNYFLGNDPSHWATDCGNFEQVTLKEVWEGVDVVWRGDSQQIKRIEQMGEALESASSAQSAVNNPGLVEFDFLIHPGADPSPIRLACMGLSGAMEVTSAGEELLLPTSLGVLRQALPEAWQEESNGSITPVKAEFRILGDGAFGVALPEGHDATKPLVVDPLVFSTFLGGSHHDVVHSMIPDGADGVILVGWTVNNVFPTTTGSRDTTYNGNRDCFVTRLNGAGSQLIYSTYLGGAGWDEAWAVSPDGAGGLFVAGRTESQDFPTTPGAFRPTLRDTTTADSADVEDSFVARLNAGGSALIFGTYLGGSDEDYILATAPDGVGGVVATGWTSSADFPVTTGAFDEFYNRGFNDAFVARLNSDGDTLIYGTFLGGSEEDAGLAIAPAGDGGVMVGGITYSTRFPTTDGAYDGSFNLNGDGFIVRLSADGSQEVYGTFLGGAGRDVLFALTSDGAGGMIAAGATFSSDFPTTAGAFDTLFNGGTYDAFVTRLHADSSRAIFSTYLGGRYGEEARAIALDRTGLVTIAGWTTSDDFPTTVGALDRSFNKNSDAFVARLNGDGDALIYCTFLGGPYRDEAYGVVSDGNLVTMAGITYSDGFWYSRGAFDSSYSGGSDVFITRLDVAPIGQGEARAPLPPAGARLAGLFPNPFNSITRVSFELPGRSWVTLRVIDASGRQVASLMDGTTEAGRHEAVWDVGGVPAGIYLLRLEAGGKVAVAKGVVVK